MPDMVQLEKRQSAEGVALTEIGEPKISGQLLGQFGLTAPDPEVIFVFRFGSIWLGTYGLGESSRAFAQLSVPNVCGNVPMGELDVGSEVLNLLLDGLGLVDRVPLVAGAVDSSLLLGTFWLSTTTLDCKPNPKEGLMKC